MSSSEWGPACIDCGAPRLEVQSLFAVKREKPDAPYHLMLFETPMGTVFLAGGPPREEGRRSCEVCAEANTGDTTRRIDGAKGPDGLVAWVCRRCFAPRFAALAATGLFDF